MQNENDMLDIDASKNPGYLIEADSFCRKRNPKAAVDNDDDCDSLSDNEDGSDGERQFGDGTNENDTFLTTHDAAAV